MNQHIAQHHTTVFCKHVLSHKMQSWRTQRGINIWVDSTNLGNMVWCAHLKTAPRGALLPEESDDQAGGKSGSGEVYETRHLAQMITDVLRNLNHFDCVSHFNISWLWGGKSDGQRMLKLKGHCGILESHFTKQRQVLPSSTVLERDPEIQWLNALQPQTVGVIHRRWLLVDTCQTCCNILASRPQTFWLKPSERRRDWTSRAVLGIGKTSGCLRKSALHLWTLAFLFLIASWRRSVWVLF